MPLKNIQFKTKSCCFVELVGLPKYILSGIYYVSIRFEYFFGIDGNAPYMCHELLVLAQGADSVQILQEIGSVHQNIGLSPQLK
jgi:hypothetical protein